MAKDEELSIASELFEVLATMNNGRTIRQLESQFEELRGAVVDTESKGKLTIELSVSFGKKNLNKVVCKSTLKLPQEAPEESVFYFDEKNRLVRDDPRQMQLPGVGKVVKLRREDVPQAAEAHNA